MIELYSPERLTSRAGRNVRIGGGLAAAGIVALGVHGAWLVHQLVGEQTQRQDLQAQLALLNRKSALAPGPTPALIADLRRQAERLEAELVAQGEPGGDDALTPVAWLTRLDALASSELSLVRIEIERAGSARIEGQARTPQALSSFVQAWEGQGAQLPARTIDIRQDPHDAPVLRFALTARAPEPRAAPDDRAAESRP